MAAIDTLRDVVRDYGSLEEQQGKLQLQLDVLRGERDGLAAELDSAQERASRDGDTITRMQADLLQRDRRIAELEARIRQLETPAAPGPVELLLFQDGFREQPIEAPDRYAIDAPPGALSVNPPMLISEIRYNQVLNHAGRCKAQLGPRLGTTSQIPGRLQFLKKYFIEVGLLVPNDWVRDGSKVAFMSVHGTEDQEEKGAGRNGCLGFHIVGDRLRMLRSWSDKPIQPANELSNEDWTFPYVPGKWYDFRIEACFDWRDVAAGGIGSTKVICNGQVISDFRGANCFNDRTGPCLIIGCYHPSWSVPERNGKEIPKNQQHWLGYRRLRLGEIR